MNGIMSGQNAAYFAGCTIGLALWLLLAASDIEEWATRRIERRAEKRASHTTAPRGAWRLLLRLLWLELLREMTRERLVSTAPLKTIFRRFWPPRVPACLRHQHRPAKGRVLFTRSESVVAGTSLPAVDGRYRGFHRG